MNTRSARIISVILHPLLLPAYILGLLFWFDPTHPILLPVALKLYITCTVLITTCLSPLLIILILYRLRIISSVYLPLRHERILPLIGLAIFYYLTFYLIKDIYLPRHFQIFILGSTLLAVLTMLVTMFFRISMHMVGWGAVTGLFLGIVLTSGSFALLMLIAAILVSGITGTARLKLDAHQPREIYSGWLMGVVVMCVTAMLL